MRTRETSTRHRGSAAGVAKPTLRSNKACRWPSALKDRSSPTFRPSNPSARQPHRCAADHPSALVVSRPQEMHVEPKNVLPPLF